MLYHTCTYLCKGEENMKSGNGDGLFSTADFWRLLLTHMWDMVLFLQESAAMNASLLQNGGQGKEELLRQQNMELFKQIEEDKMRHK